MHRVLMRILTALPHLPSQALPWQLWKLQLLLAALLQQSKLLALSLLQLLSRLHGLLTPVSSLAAPATQATEQAEAQAEAGVLLAAAATGPQH